MNIDLQTILMWSGIAVSIYFILTLVEKFLIKRKAKKVMQYDDRTSTDSVGIDDNK